MRTLRTISLLPTVLLAALLLGCMQSPEEKVATHYERGLGYLENGQFREAVIEFKNVLQVDPSHGDAHYHLGLSYLKLGTLTDLQAAFRALVKTVELEPDNNDAKLKLGELYLLSKEPEKGREQADIILASMPQDLEGLSLRGRSLLAEQEFQQGIADLKKAIQKDPSNVRLYLILARA